MNIRLVAQDKDVLRWKWIKQGLFFCTGALPADVLEANQPEYTTRDAGPFHARAFYPIAKADVGLVVRGDSDIKSIHDIKPGTKIIYGTFSVSSVQFMEAACAWANVDPDDMEWVPVGSIAAFARFIIEGKGDITFGFPATAAWIEAEAAPHSIRWIPMDPNADPEGAARFVEARPDTTFGIMDQGVPSAHGVPSVSSVSTYVTTAEAPTDLVYNLVKWLDENYDKYKGAHPWAASMTVDNVLVTAETDFIPLHDGTVKYLEELGKWTPKHEARRQENIELIERYVVAFDEAIDMADEQKIKVDPENEEWIELWQNHVKSLNLPHFKKFLTGLD